MKLYYTPTSPFVRKVLIAAIELGLRDRIQTELLRPSPTVASKELSQHNPLSKIPALVLDDGGTLYDSSVICEYLETLAGRRLVPAEGTARFEVLRTAALCDGILDAAILVFYERHQRPPELHWEPWISGQTTKALQGLDALEALAPGWSEEVDLGQVCAGATLGWLDFRGVTGDLWADRPALKAWYDRFSARPSMVQTVPVA